jgi:hypothetical protein
VGPNVGLLVQYLARFCERTGGTRRRCAAIRGACWATHRSVPDFGLLLFGTLVGPLVEPDVGLVVFGALLVGPLVGPQCRRWKQCYALAVAGDDLEDRSSTSAASSVAYLHCYSRFTLLDH